MFYLLASHEGKGQDQPSANQCPLQLSLAYYSSALAPGFQNSSPEM